MKVNLDYPKAKESKETNQEMTRNFIELGTNSLYPQGFDSGSQRRTFGRLQRKLDEAVEKRLDEIELADDERDLLKEVFITKNPKLPPSWSKWLGMVEDEIEKSLENKA